MKLFSNGQKPKVLACVLTGIERTSWLNPELTQSLLAMSKDQRFDFNYFPLKDARPVEHARNISVDVAKQMDADWLISFDNDNFPIGNSLDVIAAARDDKRVIGLTYAVYNAQGIGLCPPNRGPVDGDFSEVAHVGGGCLMVHRSVWQKLKPPYFRCVLPNSYGDSLAPKHADAIGEDVYFCNKVREHGFKVWTHKTVFAGHYRTIDLTGIYNATTEARQR
jgi:hypothetical protein